MTSVPFEPPALKNNMKPLAALIIVLAALISLGFALASSPDRIEQSIAHPQSLDYDWRMFKINNGWETDTRQTIALESIARSFESIAKSLNE